MLKNDQLVYIGLELVIACLSVAGNILVCWAVCLNSNLQSITNFFVVSLAVADIAVGLLAIPFAITIRYHCVCYFILKCLNKNMSFFFYRTQIQCNLESKCNKSPTGTDVCNNEGGFFYGFYHL